MGKRKGNARSRKVWRIYLVEAHGVSVHWREFGINYTKADALREVKEYRKNFPSLKYVARGVWIASPLPYATKGIAFYDLRD